MATLHKGILGTPRGKIGNIHCYQRKGQGIIQSNPPTKPSYETAWPLTRYRASKIIELYYKTLTAAQISYLQGKASPGESALDYYIRACTSQMYQRKETHPWGYEYPYLEQKNDLNPSFEGTWEQKRLIIRIPFDSSYWTDPGTIRILFQWFKEDGNEYRTAYDTADPTPRILTIPMNTSFFSDRFVVVAWFWHLNPLASYGKATTSLYNPAFID